MKRIQAACLSQSIFFPLRSSLVRDGQARDGQARAQAAAEARMEYEEYREELERNYRENGAKYKIVSEKTLEDGSIIVRVKKKLNNYDVGDYL